MKCGIVYYSQTGNTEKIAKAVQRGIADVAGGCDLIPLADANPKRLYKYDLIGFGSPAFGVAPSNVCKFIDDMHFVGGKHAFIFGTHGTHPENFFPSLYPGIVDSGMTVIGMGDWYGNCYLLHMPEPYSDGWPSRRDRRAGGGTIRTGHGRAQRCDIGGQHQPDSFPAASSSATTRRSGSGSQREAGTGREGPDREIWRDAHISRREVQIPQMPAVHGELPGGRDRPLDVAAGDSRSLRDV